MSVRLLSIAGHSGPVEIYSTSRGPSQLPANYADQGRFVWELSAKGEGRNLTPTEQTGMSLWQWNPGANRYDLVNFLAHPSYWDYAIRLGTYAAVSNTEIIAVDGGYLASSQDTIAYRARWSMGASPSLTLAAVAPYTNCGNEAVTGPEFFSNGIGYNGALLFGYYDSDYAAADGYISKLTASSLVNSPAIQNPKYGQPAVGACGLGGTSPNGYVVCSSQPDASTTKYALVNCTGTPGLVATCSFAGSPNSGSPIPLSATRVAVADSLTAQTKVGRVSLLYTNSASTPTTLTKGAECAVPLHPSLNIDQVSYMRASGWTQASNYWSGGSKALCWCYAQMDQAYLPPGITFRYYYYPVVIEASSDSSISLTIPATDIHGQPAPLLIHDDEHNIGNYTLNVLGTPDGKAVIMYPSVIRVTPGLCAFTQQTFQL